MSVFDDWRGTGGFQAGKSELGRGTVGLMVRKEADLGTQTLFCVYYLGT